MATKKIPTTKAKRVYVKQADIPLLGLDEALRVPEAIFSQYAGKPSSPLQIAKALEVDPKGSQFKVLTGAAIAYGLIEGGAQAITISPTELASRIFRPKQEGVDLLAKQEALLKLPSNLQGLYEVRYPGDTLDANATIKLLEAIKDIKNYSIPN